MRWNLSTLRKVLGLRYLIPLTVTRSRLLLLVSFLQSTPLELLPWQFSVLGLSYSVHAANSVPRGIPTPYVSAISAFSPEPLPQLYKGIMAPESGMGV